MAVKAFGWGINMGDWTEELSIKPTFTALSGMLSLSYFIHNIIISIMKNNKHQEHNVSPLSENLQYSLLNLRLQGRDLSIAFGLITFTYLFIGIVFYVSFPLAKSCIQDVSLLPQQEIQKNNNNIAEYSQQLYQKRHPDYHC